jgi:glycosyltransferase involved in cell wall biosynthesis
MGERYAHVLVPDDVVSANSRSAVLMVARELVRAHRARGRDAALVASASAVADDAAEESVLPVLQGNARHGLRARARNVLEGRLLGRRPTFTRAYRGLESLPGIDVVLLHNRPEGLRAAPSGACRVLYLHNDTLRHYTTRELRGLGPHLDLVVCVSRSLADRLPDALHAPRAVVLNGVDTDVFRPDRGTQEAGRRGDVPTVLFCGRVIEDKGVHLLIEAAARLRHLPFRVRVVGSGSTGERLSPYERRLRRAVADRGLADRVEFERRLPRSAVAESMRRSDVLAVPSTWPDPCPLVMLEGLASGLAVVAARTGGIPELGADACSYHEPDDVDGLAQQLELLIGDAGARGALAESARRRALQLDWAAAEENLVRAVTEQAAT